MSSNRVQATQTVAANLKVDPSGVTSPVSAASLPLPSGAATSALQGGGLPAALASGGGLKVDGSGTALPVSGTVAVSTALALDATLVTTNTEVGGVTETAPASDTASSGLNGRLQRIAQRLTSLIALLPAALSSNGGFLVRSSLLQVNISQTPTVSTSPAYTAGDALGGLLTFANAARLSGGSGLVQAITVMCKTPALVPALDLYLFNQTFTATSDNAAFAPSDGDMANCIGVIPISAWAAETASSLNSIATRFPLAFPFLLTGTSLFGQLVTRTAFTAAGTTDFVIGLAIVTD